MYGNPLQRGAWTCPTESLIPPSYRTVIVLRHNVNNGCFPEARVYFPFHWNSLRTSFDSDLYHPRADAWCFQLWILPDMLSGDPYGSRHDDIYVRPFRSILLLLSRSAWQFCQYSADHTRSRRRDRPLPMRSTSNFHTHFCDRQSHRSLWFRCLVLN